MKKAYDIYFYLKIRKIIHTVSQHCCIVFNTLDEHCLSSVYYLKSEQYVYTNIKLLKFFFMKIKSVPLCKDGKENIMNIKKMHKDFYFPLKI